jgi:hypothetical protein
VGRATRAEFVRAPRPRGAGRAPAFAARLQANPQVRITAPVLLKDVIAVECRVALQCLQVSVCNGASRGGLGWVVGCAGRRCCTRWRGRCGILCGRSRRRCSLGSVADGARQRAGCSSNRWRIVCRWVCEACAGLQFVGREGVTGRHEFDGGGVACEIGNCRVVGSCAWLERHPTVAGPG